MSIIELMIAMTILAIAMLASMVMVMIGMQTDNSSKTDLEPGREIHVVGLDLKDRVTRAAWITVFDRKPSTPK